MPAVTTGLASPGSFSQVPAYWVSAANWVTAHAGNQAVLIEPGSAFAEYTWAARWTTSPALTNADWAERDLEVVGPRVTKGFSTPSISSSPPGTARPA